MCVHVICGKLDMSLDNLYFPTKIPKDVNKVSQSDFNLKNIRSSNQYTDDQYKSDVLTLIWATWYMGYAD